LAKLSGKRQADLKDPQRKDDMAAARATLKESSKMLLSSSKVNFKTFAMNKNVLIVNSQLLFNALIF